MGRTEYGTLVSIFQYYAGFQGRVPMVIVATARLCTFLSGRTLKTSVLGMALTHHGSKSGVCDKEWRMWFRLNFLYDAANYGVLGKVPQNGLEGWRQSASRLLKQPSGMVGAALELNMLALILDSVKPPSRLMTGFPPWVKRAACLLAGLARLHSAEFQISQQPQPAYAPAIVGNCLEPSSEVKAQPCVPG